MAASPELYIGKVDQQGVTQAWAVVEIDPQWQAAYRLVLQHGVLVIGEVRVLPREGSDKGQWTAADTAGLHTAVPIGGVRARLLRRVPIPAIGQYARKVTDGLALMPRAVRNHISKEIGMDVGDGSWVDTVTMSKDLTQRLKLLQSGDVQPSPSRRGRKGRGDAFYARIAQTYATEAEKGTRRGMLEIIRKQHRLATINHARAAVYRAREMKFLEGRQLGVVSGALTDKARAILTPPRRTVTRSPATRKKAIPGPSKRTRTRRR